MKSFTTIICLLFLSPIFLSANTVVEEIEKILEQIQKASDPHEVIDLYDELFKVKNIPTDSTYLSYAQDLQQYAEKNKKENGIALSNKHLGYYNLITSKIDDAIINYKQAIDYYKKVKDEENAVSLLRSLGICYERQGNLDEVIKYAEEALQISENQSDTKVKANALKRMAEVYGNMKNDREKGLEYINQAITIYEELEDQAGLMTSLYAKGTILSNYDNDAAYTNLKRAEELAVEENEQNLLVYIRGFLVYQLHSEGKISEAIEIAATNLESAISSNEKERIIQGHISLGDLYTSLKHKTKPIEHYTKAINLARESNLVQVHIASSGGLGLFYSNNENYKDAIKYLEISYFKADSIKNDYLSSQVLTELGSCYLFIGELEKGKECFIKLLEITKGSNEVFENNANVGLGNYYFLKGDLGKAEKILLSSEQWYKDSKEILMHKRCIGILSDLYKKRGDYKKAYQYSIKHFELQDSLNVQENQDKITTLRLTSEFEKEKEILALINEKEQTILKEKESRARLLGFGALAGLILLSLFYFLLRKKNSEISSQKNNLEKLNNVKDQLFQIIGHDLRKPVIAFRNVSENLNYLIEQGDEDRLKRLGAEIEEEGKSLYNLTDNLLHWALMQKDVLTIKPEKINLHGAVNENIQLFKKVALQKDITITNNLAPETTALVDHNSLQTIIRNILDNALKFTPEGGAININADTSGGNVKLSISDNGIGMNPDLMNTILMGDDIVSQDGTSSEKGSGLGMKIIKSMVEKNGGKLGIESEAEKGSVISISLKQAV